jgi:hypothetical protein
MSPVVTQFSVYTHADLARVSDSVTPEEVNEALVRLAIECEWE